MKGFSGIIATCALAVIGISCTQQHENNNDLLQYVDPFVGTTYTGHTHPCATYPFGLMQPGPQTGNFEWDYCAGYRYEDTQMWGFTQNRLNGTGIPDMGDLLMMPFSGTPAADYKSSFSKETEKASPGYYTVDLIENHVKVELTTSPHVAMHRYRFAEDNPGVYIDFQSGTVGNEWDYNHRVLSATVNVEDSFTITGHQVVKAWVERQLFYVIQFDKPFVSVRDLPVAEGNKAPKKVFLFHSDEKEMQVKIAFSTVSIEGAIKNMKSENHRCFEQVKADAENVWQQYLSRITIEGTDEQKKNFYTAAYHLLSQPSNIADVDGQYRGANDTVFTSPFGKYYSTFSLWDTYRAAHPLYTIYTPELVSNMTNTMLLHADTQGFLPIWALWGKENYCMIGNHSIPVVVEACLKDFPGIDQENAYRLIKQSLTVNHYRSEWNIYDQYGYFPFDLIPEESVSRTLECGYDDYCAALLAQKLNKKDDCQFFMKRANYYKNLFDPTTKLMRGKDSQGNWRTPFDAYHLSHAGTAGGDYTEGNAWQYTWYVQQDVDGLVELMGGKEAFATQLDSLFIVNTTAQQTGFVGDVTGLIGQTQR
ncbi:alpha-1 2-mannosidase [Bacteroidia bacterium]|nr:alpha-1 2-mannosidase [Bacteroidia bacterium]